MRKMIWRATVSGVVLALVALGGWLLTLGGPGLFGGGVSAAVGSIDEVGIDMLPLNGGGNTTTTLGDIDNICIEKLNTDDDFDVDIYIKDFPADSPVTGMEGPFFYTDDTKLSVVAASGSVSFINTIGGSSIYALSEALPTPPSTNPNEWYANVIDAGAYPGTSEMGQGYFQRVTLDITGVGPAILPLTLGSVASGYPWIVYGNGNSSTEYPITTLNPGTPMIALDMGCPEPTDVEVVSVTPTSPATLDVSTDGTLAGTVSVRNNSGMDPVNATLTITVAPPSGCTADPEEQSSAFDLAVGAAVDKTIANVTIHCTEVSTHVFGVTAEIQPTDPEVPDPVDNNTKSADPAPSVDVLATADLKLLTQILTITNPDTPWGEGGVPNTHANCSDTIDNDLDTFIDAADSDCKLSAYPKMTLSTDYDLQVDKVMHNNGAYTPVVTNIAKGAFFSPSAAGGEGAYSAAWCVGTADEDGDTVVNDGCPGGPPATGTGQVAGDCQVTPATAGDQVTLVVGLDDQTHTEHFSLHCGGLIEDPGPDQGPCTDDLDNGGDGVADIDGATGYAADPDCMMNMGFDNDTDSFIDEDPHDGVDNDLDGKIDEDSAFQIAVFAVSNTILPKDPHITDTDPANNVNVTTIAALAVRPYTPTFSLVIDEADAANPTDPVDDICLTGDQPCKVWTRYALPAGNPLPGVVSYTPLPFSIAHGTEVANGLVAGQVSFTVYSDGGVATNCQAEVSGTLDAPGLVDGAISAAAGEGPDDGTAGALANPAVYPTRLNSDKVVAALIASGAPMWARYQGYITGLTLPVNVLVFNLGASGFANVTVNGDPSVPDPKDKCTPYSVSSILQGEYCDYSTPPDCVPTDINRLTCGTAGNYTFASSFTRADIGVKTTLTDTTNKCLDLGDVNCDYKRNVTDALFIHQEYLTLRTSTTNCPPEAGEMYDPVGDVNGDTAVNVTDAMLVHQCYLGIPNDVLCPAP